MTPALVINHRALDSFSGDVPTCCAVCRRRAFGIGYGILVSPTSAAVIHCCFDDTCVRTVQRIATMTDERFDAHEEKALDEAGVQGGAYLDRIGNSDLAKLTEKQWHKFLEEILKGFGDSMRRQLTQNEAPF